MLPPGRAPSMDRRRRRQCVRVGRPRNARPPRRQGLLRRHAAASTSRHPRSLSRPRCPLQPRAADRIRAEHGRHWREELSVPGEASEENWMLWRSCCRPSRWRSRPECRSSWRSNEVACGSSPSRRVHTGQARRSVLGSFAVVEACEQEPSGAQRDARRPDCRSSRLPRRQSSAMTSGRVPTPDRSRGPKWSRPCPRRLRGGRRGCVAPTGPAAIPERPPGHRRAQARLGERRWARAQPTPRLRARPLSAAERSRCPVTRRAGRIRRPQRAPAPGRFPVARARRKIQRAESALSVRPISMCLASVVTFGSASPALRAASSAKRTSLAKAVQPDGSQPALDCGEQLADPGLRRIGPLGLGNDVDLAPVKALRHDLGAKRRARRAAPPSRRLPHRAPPLPPPSHAAKDQMRSFAHRRGRPRSRG